MTKDEARLRAKAESEVLADLQKGGEWLGAARVWMQSNVRGGDSITWGSTEQVSVSFAALEALALRVAVAAVVDDRYKNQ